MSKFIFYSEQRNVVVTWVAGLLCNWHVKNSHSGLETYHREVFSCFPGSLTLSLLTWTIWRAPTNASKWRMGFNSAFKGLK